jgi:acetyl esterase/lipase
MPSCRLMIRAVLTIVGISVIASTPAARAEVRKQTFTYKKADTLEIKADVYREADDRPRPVVVWLHGGALIMGHREGVSQRLKDAMLNAGYVVVSLDYRLAPETQLPQIIQDIEDGLTWVHDRGPELFHADANRIAVSGGSAGGYLTLTAGFRAKYKPVALLAFWGYGDLVGDWFSRPSPHPRHNKEKVSREHAYQQVSGPPVADARERKGDGAPFYNYCRQTGEWPKAVSGWDPHKEPEKFAPYMALKNVTKDYPPTFLIHGDTDTDVPHEQSVLMAAELKRNGVPHRLVSLRNGEHGLQGADKAQVDDAYQQAFAFLREHLDRK